jgi:hypothetical protein
MDALNTTSGEPISGENRSPPTWELIGGVMQDSGVRRLGVLRGRWALEVLAADLGPMWPIEAINQFGEIPLPLLLASGHTIAYAQTLEIALRVHLLRHVSGFADARNEIKGDRRADGAMHFTLQMEVAGLARRCGWPYLSSRGARPPRTLRSRARLDRWLSS